MEEQIDTDKAENIKEIIKGMDLNFLDHSIIQDNRLYFSHEEKSYRVVMPSPKNLSEAEQIKHQEYGRLLKTKGYYLEKVLKKILKENQGVDIKELEEEKELVLSRLKDAYLELADFGDSQNEEVIKERQEKVEKIKLELVDANNEILQYLEPSIEKQIEKAYMEYLTYLCSEKQTNAQEEKWELNWESYEKLREDNNPLAIKCINRLTQLILDSREIL